MYSDSYDNELDLAQHFGLSNELLLSDQFYEMPQSLDFGLENNDENDNDNDEAVVSSSRQVMSSPLHHYTQPMTVRKLKSHLSGIGGEGGYLTSPMGGFSRNAGDLAALNSMNNTPRTMLNTRGTTSSNFHQSPVKSAPMPSIPTFQSTSQQQSFSIGESAQHDFVLPAGGGHAMQRLRSAPPVPMSQNTAAAGLGLASTSASTAMQRARTTSAITSNSSSNINEGRTSRGGVEVSSFESLDYGSMQIYGRPIQRSKSEDPGPSTSNTNNPSSVYLPYPEHMPTVTLGRGAKNARDIDSSNSNNNHNFISITLPPSSRPEKPFIQYVAPNSPAGKQATARNKRQLTISTDGSSSGNGTAKTSKASSSRMVPIKMMSTTSPRQLPLSPPLTSVRSMSPSNNNNNTNAYNEPTNAQFSPSKQLDYNYPTSHDIHIATQSAPLPSFEWSVEQYGLHSHQPQLDDLQFDLPGDETLDQHAAYLGGLLPTSLPNSGMESTSLSPVSSSGGGLMSPPLYSASSTTSSMYSSSAEQQEALFGLPPSPLFDGPASIDQALASFLGEQQISMPSQQQQQQDNQTFSPSSNHQQRTMLGMGSPPMSPLPQHQSQNSNFQWSPYSQQQHQNTATSPIHLEPLSHINNNLLSPHSNGNILSTVNGRQISSPRRLRGMQSAPDLGNMYAASNEFSENNNVRSPSPRKASLKRQRSYYDSEDDAEIGASKGRNAGNVFGIPVEGDNSFSDGDEDDEDEYVPEDEDPRPRKRSCSISASTYTGMPMYQQQQQQSQEQFLQVFRADMAQQQQLQQQQVPKLSTQPPNQRMKPGPRPKTSLPNLRGRNSVFTVADNAPPVPPLPPLPPVDFASYTTLQIPQMSGMMVNQNHGLTSPLISPDLYSPNSYETHQLQYQQQQQQPPMQLQPIPYRTVSTPPTGSQTHSKDELANYYETGTGSKQTKKGKPQRMYICKVQGCGKEFPRKSAVESHIQTHLDDKPFLCTSEGCGASFVRSHDLTRHMRIHSGSKPFECLCGKGFARGDALTRHRQRGICEGSLVPRRW